MVRFVREMEIVRQEKLIEQVPQKTKLLVDGLLQLAATHGHRLFNVRGAGLYQGFTMRTASDKGKLLDAALENENLLLLGAGAQTIRLRPMLDVTPDDIRLLLEKLDRCLGAL